VRDPAGPALRKLRDSPVTHGDQQMTGLRYDNWKFVFGAAGPGNTAHLGGALRRLALLKLFNLRTDPYEGADVASNTDYDWIIDYAFTFVPAQAFVAQFLTTFKDYPQRQKAATFNGPCRISVARTRSRWWSPLEGPPTILPQAPPQDYFESRVGLGNHLPGSSPYQREAEW